ncbi:Chromosome transmission fidelity protein 18 like protein [Argiope bruennichi]|uniref:Chromosome transmission fidelity protein 18 like protein n=1 Tax=Argiope bruennichi TaxID=94029 RepID=A0A8T0EDR1_ARGBR|nr:Chromosome transmission fidelity protein 18 like protein [Argiope bruennichi]
MNMDYPTEEELYELQHQDELDALNDIEPSDPYGNDDFDPFSIYSSREPVSKKAKVNDCDSNQNVSTSIIGSHEHLQNKNFRTGEDKSSSSASVSCGSPKQSKEHSENAVENSPKSAERSTLEATSNIKRNLLFELNNTEENLDCDESLTSQTEKRKLSDLSDDGVQSGNTGKRRCNISESEIDISSILSTSTQQPSYSRSFLNSSKETLTLTRSDGQRIYFSLNDEDDDSNKIESFSQKTSCLLQIPIHFLKFQYFAMEEKALKEQEETQMENDCVMLEGNKENIPEHSLWVEKYRPLSYMHLLSEEGINRTLLQWLKLWDKVVFGKEKKAKKKVAEPKKPNKYQKTWGELIEDLDEHGRPYHKVAFLCGPPGLGKTTLATIIARHAGYNVVEINASDDRNPEAFRTALEAATQMKSVLHQDHRPNCLILDEIDGAPAASINVLISFIKSAGIPKGQKRKKGDIPLLTRPIICICNDQYSAALKPLRQLALVLNFPSTATSRLASRLQEISSKEGLHVDMAALTLLCEKTCNDVRSCLSTLQFLHRSKKELKISDLEGLQIGQKDMQKSLFGVWQDVFYYKEKKSFSNVLSVLQAFGDYEKVYIGLFENYLNIKFKHRNLDSVWMGSEWLCFVDIIQQQIAHQQLFFLIPYLPYPAVAFHVLFASNSYPHMSYPTAFYENRAKVSQLNNTLTSLIKDITSSLKTFLNSAILLTDVFPFLVEIIKPNLRPVNTQLYSEREKNELRRVIELMLAFNLNYRQERSLEGTYNYILDPNIEELIRFSDIKTKNLLTYSAKQMIAREVEMEQMRKGDSASDEKAKNVSKEKVSVHKPEPKIFQQKEISERPVLDFFGRQIIPTAKEDTENKKDPRDEEVWFHFKEGYSNAVRRTVHIKNLL